MAFLTRTSPVAAALALVVACNPGAFDDVKETASTRIFDAPDGFSDTRFGESIAGFEATIDGVRVSRIAVSSGPGGPVAVYTGWTGTTFPNDALLYNTCEDLGDCEADAGTAVAGIPIWRAGTPQEAHGCVLVTAPATGGLNIYCELTGLREPVTGIRAGIELGKTAVSLGAATLAGVAALGAPSDDGGAGAVYRVSGGAVVTRVDLPPGTAPPSGQLGSVLAAYALAADRALVAATAPRAGRVVLMTLFSDGTVSVNACIDDAMPGFGGALALGNVVPTTPDDGIPDLVVGNGNAAGRLEEVRVYESSSMPAPGCSPWGMAPLVVPCPEGIDGIDCAGSMFGSSLAVGDVNADGIDDVIAGAPLADVDGEADAGAVYVMPGAGAGPSSSGAVALTHSTPEPGGRIGTVLSTLPTGLATGLVPRVEPVASSPGQGTAGVGHGTLVVFLCTGLAGDTPEIGERCVPH